MNNPAELKYTKDHEWIRVDGDTAVVGITDHAQDQLGDVVFVDLPAVGTTVEAGAACGSIESVKAVSDLFAPLSGEVVEVNEALMDAPEVVNADVYGEGWMLKMKLSDTGQLEALLSAADYAQQLAAEK